jgi:hypothetical protein
MVRQSCLVGLSIHEVFLPYKFIQSADFGGLRVSLNPELLGYFTSYNVLGVQKLKFNF